MRVPTDYLMKYNIHVSRNEIVLYSKIKYCAKLEKQIPRNLGSIIQLTNECKITPNLKEFILKLENAHPSKYDGIYHNVLSSLALGVETAAEME